MEKLPERFIKNGFIYNQLEKSQFAAIYSQSVVYTGRVDWFEVWAIRQRNERIIKGRVISASEVGPSQDEWGRRGWTFYTYPEALEKFYELTSNGLVRNCTRFE